MNTLDVREGSIPRIDQIIFAGTRDVDISIAYTLVRDDTNYCREDEWNALRICDEEGYSLISSADQARNLIKALEAAISLGWVK